MNDARRMNAGDCARLSQEIQRHYVNRKVVERPAATRALFVAAHADDVEIGCGGTVLKLVDAQVPLKQVVLTDGRLAAPKPEEEAEMVRVRADEARSVAAHLMLPPPELFGVSERELFAPAELEPMVARLAALLAEWKPDALFVPWFFDQHPDHRYANRILARALSRSTLDLSGLTVHGYEVWSLVPPGLVVDVTAVFAEKRRLVSLYRSQLKLMRYLELVDELARPRALLAGEKAQAAEFFCPLRGDDYVVRAESLDFESPESRATTVMLAPL
jgi:LmbE family N-acetylglucosaminyl deacetylase